MNSRTRRSKHKPETHLYCSLADKLGKFTSPDAPLPLVGAPFPIFIKIKIDELTCLCAVCGHRNQDSTSENSSS